MSIYLTWNWVINRWLFRTNKMKMTNEMLIKRPIFFSSHFFKQRKCSTQRNAHEEKLSMTNLHPEHVIFNSVFFCCFSLNSTWIYDFFSIQLTTSRPLSHCFHCEIPHVHTNISLAIFIISSIDDYHKWTDLRCIHSIFHADTNTQNKRRDEKSLAFFYIQK